MAPKGREKNAACEESRYVVRIPMEFAVKVDATALREQELVPQDLSAA